MKTPYKLLLIVLALVCFGLQTVNSGGKVNWNGLGLFCLTLTLLLY